MRGSNEQESVVYRSGVLIIVGVVLVFVTKNASKLIKEKIEASIGKNVTVRDISVSWGGVDVTGVAITKDGDLSSRQIGCS